MPNLEVTAVDLTILIGYVVLPRVLFGWYLARKTRGEGAESCFLAGRDIRWPIIGLPGTRVGTRTPGCSPPSSRCCPWRC